MTEELDYVSLIPPYDAENIALVNSVIEISKNTFAKYEYNETYKILQLNRISKLVYPVSYGFIPGTHADDGDPLDIFLYENEPVAPCTLVKCKIVGALWMKDKGFMDYKLVGIPNFNSNIDKYTNIHDLDKIFLDNVKNFFKIYKLKKKKKCEVEIRGWLSSIQANAILKRSIKSYNKVT